MCCISNKSNHWFYQWLGLLFILPLHEAPARSPCSKPCSTSNHGPICRTSHGIRTDTQPQEDTTNRTRHGIRTVEQLIVKFIEQSYGIKKIYNMFIILVYNIILFYRNKNILVVICVMRGARLELIIIRVATHLSIYLESYTVQSRVFIQKNE